MTDNSTQSSPETVKVNGITVQKVKMREYPAILNLLQDIVPKIQPELEGKDGSGIMFALPKVLGIAFDDIVAVLVRCTDADKEKILDCDFETTKELFTKVLEVNGFLGMLSQAQESVKNK